MLKEKKPVSLQEKQKPLSFAEIRNMYYDGCIERELKQKMPDMKNWQFQKNYANRNQAGSCLVYVTLNDGTGKGVSVNMLTLMNCRANKKDVLEYIEEKTSDIKAFIRQILIDFEDEKLEQKKYDCSEVSEQELDRIFDIVTDEGLRAFIQGHNIVIQRM